VSSPVSELDADPPKGSLLQVQSAGAGASAVLALMARDECLSPPLTGVVLTTPFIVSPEAVPSQFRDACKSRTQCADTPIVDRKSMESFIGKLKVFSEEIAADDSHVARYKPDLKDWQWSALLHPEGHASHPPLYFQFCSYDPLRDEALIYDKVLREQCGVKTRLNIYSDLLHLFWLAWAGDLVEELKQASQDLVDGAHGFLRS
jgi:acetyl esterase/lipase